MKVYFRVDASVHIGSGHVMRCLSLADALQKLGSDVVFVMRVQPGDLCDYTKKRGFKVEQLAQPDELINPESTTDYHAWLQVSETEDAEDFLAVAEDADLVVIDHYGINVHWETLVKSTTLCNLIAIDDLVRAHNSDMIIDQTLARKVSEYHVTSPGSHVLSGTKFALLKEQFSLLHSVALAKEIDKQVHRLLLTMGGVDNPNATLQVLNALSQRETAIKTTVLLSYNAPHFDSVASFCESNSDWLRHIPFCEDMATLMLEHTIAIGAPGSTSWERACLGLPSILIPLAENQLQICQNLVKEDAAMSLSLGEVPAQLNPKLDKLLHNFEAMRHNNLSLCDGKGCSRVVEKMRMLGWF
ncbi:UDP-2,4-diacetamido-2,4,6-trideoxy-beta-L-altropyranose hydrolase [Kangiella marina]|uniref:Glycosyl transferase family 28 C-terminal domain-containing protein n=1 Tax=Kangiella marina TaxID=1079178 RepID=A0ABP8INV4_9GAMM